MEKQNENKRKEENTVKQIAKTRELIRKKHRMLKTGVKEEEIALEKRFKPIVEPLKRIVENTEPRFITAAAAAAADNDGISYKKEKEEDDNDDDDVFTASTPRAAFATTEKKRRRLNATSSSSSYSSPIKHQLKKTRRNTDEYEDEEEEENEQEDIGGSNAFLQQSREISVDHLGPLGRRYITSLLSDDREIDHVYGVYIGKKGDLMLGDKRFDLNPDDSVIVNGVKYAGTPGLYELLFKRMPDETIFTENDKQQYKNIILATNIHRREHKALMPIMGNKGYKYKQIIAPLIKRTGGRMSNSMMQSTMRLTNNKIEYTHWDDPNELVERLRLLDASRRAGNNAHDNEIASIIEELREAGLIVN